uniref:Uncharacterized protein n=1 Tax=Trypanosoma congolense (strain IL3000) TaxID=1068625 RepID=G0V0H8_TRYCI|nr:hypothetical protein, unlikely [Trypanosoma congolense IL3000]
MYQFLDSAPCPECGNDMFSSWIAIIIVINIIHVGLAFAAREAFGTCRIKQVTVVYRNATFCAEACAVSQRPGVVAVVLINANNLLKICAASVVDISLHCWQYNKNFLSRLAPLVYFARSAVEFGTFLCPISDVVH